MNTRLALAALLVLSACSSTSPAPDETTSNEALKGCHGTASSAVPSDGAYYLTTFGGAGESQPMSCGSNTRSGSWYYAASKQRYGCGTHLRVEANGNCVVVQTDDYGPDACVERAAGRPILDASPLVARALFGEAELGWSDRREIQATEVSSSTPLGPCAGDPDRDQNPDGSGDDPGASSTGEEGSSGGDVECASDGDCNPGDDGSGMICSDGACVPGCHRDNQCPGDAVCIDGACQ